MFLGLRIPLARAHALAQRAGLGTKVTVVVILGWTVAVSVCLYFWVQGHLIAAMLMSVPVVAFGFNVAPPLAVTALVVIWAPMIWRWYRAEKV